jgi:hypothetical protein
MDQEQVKKLKYFLLGLIGYNPISILRSCQIKLDDLAGDANYEAYMAKIPGIETGTGPPKSFETTEFEGPYDEDNITDRTWKFVEEEEDRYCINNDKTLFVYLVRCVTFRGKTEWQPRETFLFFYGKPGIISNTLVKYYGRMGFILAPH